MSWRTRDSTFNRHELRKVLQTAQPFPNSHKKTTTPIEKDLEITLEIKVYKRRKAIEKTPERKESFSLDQERNSLMETSCTSMGGGRSTDTDGHRRDWGRPWPPHCFGRKLKKKNWSAKLSSGFFLKKNYLDIFSFFTLLFEWQNWLIYHFFMIWYNLKLKKKRLTDKKGIFGI